MRAAVATVDAGFHKAARGAAGVVYTPQLLANAMVHALGDASQARWLDPCVGKGAFLTELAKLGVPRKRIVALDIRSRAELSDALAQTTRDVDFLKWIVDKQGEFDRIVANPPYVPLSKLGRTRRGTALRTARLLGMPIDSRANYWSAFLIAAVRALRTGGGLCFVLPAAWEYANYARPLREQLPQYFAHVVVHRSRSPLFPDVADGSVVIVATGRGMAKSQGQLLHCEHASPAELLAHLGVQFADLAAQHAEPRPLLQEVRPGTARVGELMQIQLGGVTGRAEFFLLTEAQRTAYRLPKRALRPVLSRARHLVAARMTEATWRSLQNRDERIWLFRPTKSLARRPAVKRYLSKLTPAARATVFKLANRRPWYQTPLPTKAQGFLSGMCGGVPWICISGMPRLSASNTLYVVNFRRAKTRDQQAQIALGLLTSEAARLLGKIARHYPDGLVKYEPGDLHDLVLPVRSVSRGSFATYERAVALLRANRIPEVRLLADEWFAKSI